MMKVRRRDLERTVATSSRIEGINVFMPLYELDELACSIRRRIKSPKGKSILIPVKFLERALVIIEKAIDLVEERGKEEICQELLDMEPKRIYPRMASNEKTIKKKATPKRVHRVRT